MRAHTVGGGGAGGIRTFGLILAAAVLFLTWPFSTAKAGSGDHLWNYRENGDDRFHDNEPWLRPWDGNNESRGKWVGYWTYEVPWGPVTTRGNPDGSLTFPGNRDQQFHIWTYVYVKTAKTIKLCGGGDCVPRGFLNYAFDSPEQFCLCLCLVEGWNRIDITGYNQNDWYTFHVGPLAELVDAMSHVQVPIPDADFTWAPDIGWAGATEFAFTDTSANEPDAWNWDVDNDGTVDYTTQNVEGHTYPASDGETAVYSVRLEVGGMGVTDEEIKADIITVFGRPVADFRYVQQGNHGHRFLFTNQSVEPGRTELDQYLYQWDMESDGQWDTTEENPVWMFRRPGIYNVTLEVTNGAGSGSVTIPVDVRPPRRGPP